MANSELGYFWLLILLTGTIVGLLLALTNLYISKSDKSILEYNSKKEPDRKTVISERHRYGISFYLYYPMVVCFSSVFAFITINFQDIIDKIGDKFIVYIIGGLALILLYIVYVIAACGLMVLIEGMMSYFIRTHYKRKYDVKVTKDPKYFNVKK